MSDQRNFRVKYSTMVYYVIVLLIIGIGHCFGKSLASVTAETLWGGAGAEGDFDTGWPPG